jgi:hypothetical protein
LALALAGTTKAAEPVSTQRDKRAMQGLDWIIGEWVEEGDAIAFKASFRWTAGKHFIVGELRIDPKGHPSHVVTQRIGWDAAAGTIRSWNFDSHGGFSEGEWRRAGDRWIASSSGVLPGGERTLGQKVVNRIDDNSFQLASIGFLVDGERVPDLHVKLIRKPSNK